MLIGAFKRLKKQPKINAIYLTGCYSERHTEVINAAMNIDKLKRLFSVDNTVGHQCGYLFGLDLSFHPIDIGVVYRSIGEKSISVYKTFKPMAKDKQLNIKTNEIEQRP